MWIFRYKVLGFSSGVKDGENSLVQIVPISKINVIFALYQNRTRRMKS